MTSTIDSSLIDRLRAIVGPDGLLTARRDLLVYECDGFTIEKNKPDVVVFPTSTEQIVRIVKVCNELQRAVPGRGAGTSLAGGCLPVGGGVMIAPDTDEEDPRSRLRATATPSSSRASSTSG